MSMYAMIADHININSNIILYKNTYLRVLRRTNYASKKLIIGINVEPSAQLIANL